MIMIRECINCSGVDSLILDNTTSKPDWDQLSVGCMRFEILGCEGESSHGKDSGILRYNRHVRFGSAYPEADWGFLEG